MNFSSGSILSGFVVGLLLNTLLVVLLAYPVMWLWNGCISGWLHLPEMGIGDSFGVLLLLVLLSTVVRGVKITAKLSV